MKSVRAPMIRRFVALASLFVLVSCGPDEPADPATLPLPDIVATNAFYYYDDLETALNFYSEQLGFETVVDYGFAKILRIADSSYLTLVNAADGMHSSDEPKTVTLTLVTDTLADWHAYLGSKGIVTRVSFDPRRDAKAASFAIEDPEGYLLRFEAPQQQTTGGTLGQGPSAPPMTSNAGGTGQSLSVRAAIYALYMQDMETTLPFYRQLFGRDPLIDNDYAAAFKLTDSGYVALVRGSDDLQSPTEQNGVTMSFFTNDVDGWLERASNISGFELRTDDIIDESGMVRVFVGYDPEGYFLEWDTFLDRPDNTALLRYLSR